MISRILTLLLLISFVSACNFTPPKQIEYTASEEEMEEQIRQLRDFDEAAIGSGSTTDADGNATFRLTIRLTNGNVTEDNPAPRDVGLEAMKIVLEGIANEADFDQYEVIFIQRTETEITEERQEYFKSEFEE